MPSRLPPAFRPFLRLAQAGLPLLLAGAACAAGPDPLPVPQHLVVEQGIDASQRIALMQAARLYYAFWDSGEARFAREALAPEFTDRSLPPGRAQGLPGVLAASEGFRRAVPDLRVKVEEMLLVGDRVIGRLRFSGHFTGKFMDRQGSGQPVDFIATDIYRVKQGRIVENWHLEDQLSLLQQLGLITQ